MKLFLIGYMGSGKSTIGKKLAKKLKLSLIDFDGYIEKETGRTIGDIFEKEGEERFRLLEHDYLKAILYKDNTVISLGGGTPCFHNNIDLINENGTSIYIETNVDALVKRLSKAKHKRPLIKGMNEVDLRFFIEANLEKRNPVYRKAHYTVKVETQSIDEVADQIIQLIS